MTALPTPRGRQRATAAELAAAAWAGLIFATIPLVRVLREWFVARWDQALIGYGVIAVIVGAAAAGLLRLRRSSHRPPLATAPWLAAIAGILVWWTTRLWDHPEEAVHFLEYGVLGWLLARALEPRAPGATHYLSAALLGSLVGTIDEIIQWITPSRYWDLRDVALNGGACALALLARWRIQPPPAAARAQSWRLPCRLAAAQLALLALCLANTPGRVDWYAERIPGLGFLAGASEEMAEYGRRYRFPGLGEFRSRLTLEELQRTDRARWREAAAVLDRYPDSSYGRFLSDYPAHRDPFVHEARVHIFSRDHHLAERAVELPGSDAFRRHATIALREQQILELAFPLTLRASASALPPERVAELQGQYLPGRYVVSRAGSHLITWISEGQLRAVLLVLFVGLLAVDRGLAARSRWEGDAP